MFKRLAEDGREFEQKTKEHINEYAEAGLRTVLLAYREVEEDEYQDFNEAFLEAKRSVNADRDEMIDRVADHFERNLVILGATAVEDKLQNGVPECIDKLARQGIKLRVLTSDKMETTINIG
ncbi:Phospholipid-transporting ATPase 10 [Dionaea muscipula]